jgi:TonB family protein
VVNILFSRKTTHPPRSDIVTVLGIDCSPPSIPGYFSRHTGSDSIAGYSQQGEIMRRLLLAVPLLLSSLLCTAQSKSKSPQTSVPDGASLPIKRVVLYKNGVGYFEHLGHARGDQEFHINFTTAQLNDVLKSLTAVDFGGGQVTDVRYNSIAPLSQRLNTLRIQLDENTTVAALLGALRGARLEIKNGASTATGRLLSVETAKREVPATKITLEVTELTLVTDAGEMRKFELSPSTAVRVLEADLNNELKRYLELIATSRAKDVRQMTINSLGTSERDLMVSYISEVPVWKSTYRLILPAKADEKPLLQGWAIVDNTVGEDWKNVQLSLVAGAPQSFVQQISQPLYTRRPTVELPKSAMLTPQTHEGTFEAQAGQVIDATQVKELPLNGRNYMALTQITPGAAQTQHGKFTISHGAAAGLILQQADPMYPPLARSARIQGTVVLGVLINSDGTVGNVSVISGHPMLTASAINAVRQWRYRPHYVNGQPTELNTQITINFELRPEDMPALNTASAEISKARVATAEDLEKTVKIDSDNGVLGDLFQYAPKQKITVLQNQSAMVPIVQSRIDAEKVTVWNSNDRMPLRALWLKNTSGITLDGGTFNIIDSGAFAGEALMDELKPSERRLVSYAFDNPVRVRAEATTKAQPYTRVKIARGQMELVRELRSSTKYTVHNSDNTARQVVIEHPIANGYKITGTAKPEESSATLHRFQLKVEPGATAELAVDEARPETASYELSDFDREQFELLVKDLKPSPALDQAFRKLLAKQDEIAAVKKQIENLEGENERITSSQSRLRENMKALKGSSEEKTLLQRYVRELDEQENRINALDKQSEDAEAKKDKLDKELEQMMMSITLDEAL